MGEQRLRGGWLIYTLCPSNPSFSSLGSTSAADWRQPLDSSNGTAGSTHKASLPPCHVLEQWAAADGAIGTPEAELRPALPPKGGQQSGVLNTASQHCSLSPGFVIKMN